MAQRKSPFPVGFLGVDLYRGGAWQPLGADLDQAPVSIAHGARSEGGSADVSSLSFRVTNSDGKYSPRNPTSPLYGQIGRNTPARSVVALGAPWLDLEKAGSRATTPHVTALGITGDLDVRWWGYRDEWWLAADLMSKWSVTGNQRSWLLRAEADGTLTLFWTTGGVTALEARSTAPVPPYAGELAVRAFLDVNDGAGGRRVRFEYAENLSGPWVQLGEDVEQAGTTSVFNATGAALTLGKEPTSAASTPAQRVYGWQLRNSAGTVVSSRTTSALTVGATSFADDQGRTWTVTDGEVTNRHVLAVCEVAEWPVEWNTKGAESVLTQVQANGVTRRLGQGAQAVDSAIYRTITARGNTQLRGYWPMEEGSEATVLTPAVGGLPMGWAGNLDPAAYDGYPGSAPIPILRQTRMRARLPRTPNTGVVQVRFLMHVPAGSPSHSHEVGLHGSALATVTLLYGAGGTLRLLGKDGNDTQVFDSGPVAFAVDDKNLRVSIELVQAGSAINYKFATIDAAAAGLSYSGTVASTALGPVKDVLFNPTRQDLEVAVGHLTIETAQSSVYDVLPAVMAGYPGELSMFRLSRLSTEHDVPIQRRGVLSSSATVGPQRVDTLLGLMRETADADGGLLHDDQVRVGLRYRSLHSMGSQPPVVIPYTDNLIIPFEPTDDDNLTRNRVTVETPRGDRATSEVTTGPMSSQAPPSGVGLYDESLTLNLDTAAGVERTSTWRTHVGTWDEGRYPTLGVDLAHPDLLSNPELTKRLLDLTPGDRLVITDPPPWLPPRSVDVLVMGIQIEITPMSLRLRWACVPARPYHVAYWNAGHRWSGQGTALAAAVSDTHGALQLVLPDEVTWTHADGDYEIVVGGEVMTVTGVDANLLLDPSLSATVLVLNGATGTVSRPTSGGPLGDGHYRFAVATPNTASPMTMVLGAAGTAAIPVTPGQSYVLSAYARKTAGGPSMRLDVNWYDAAGTFLSASNSSSNTVGATWDRKQHVHVAPVGAATARGALVWSGTAVALQTLDWADAQFEPGTAATPYAASPSMTVTRSVNGVTKSHAAGAVVELAEPSFYAR